MTAATIPAVVNARSTGEGSLASSCSAGPHIPGAHHLNRRAPCQQGLDGIATQHFDACTLAARSFHVPSAPAYWPRCPPPRAARRKHGACRTRKLVAVRRRLFGRRSVTCSRALAADLSHPPAGRWQVEMHGICRRMECHPASSRGQRHRGGTCGWFERRWTFRCRRRRRRRLRVGRSLPCSPLLIHPAIQPS